MKKKRRIIIDTDTAADDAMAIMIASLCDDVQIEAVTIATGNVSLEQAADNALMAMELCGCDAPVYLGSAVSFTGVEKECFCVYGTDGMGDQNLIHPTKKPEKEGAIDKIIELVEQYPYEIEIIALAPVANIALAIQKAPETMSKVKRIWSMATSGLGPGNATPVSEFNVYKDVEAYDVMIKSGIPLTVIGLDMCEDKDVIITAEQVEDMKKGNELQSFIAKSFMKLLEFRTNGIGQNNIISCDGLAMVHALIDGFTTKTILCNASCITIPCEAYGQVIFYRSDYTYDSMPTLGEPNVVLVNGQKGSTFYSLVNELFTK